MEFYGLATWLELGPLRVFNSSRADGLKHCATATLIFKGWVIQREQHVVIIG